MARETVLVTGGAGYIGSHTAVALLDAGCDVVVLDNLCNSPERTLDAIRALGGRDLAFVRGDVRSFETLDRVFASHAIDAVLHFAGLKSVADSVADPLAYYLTNVAGTTLLCRAMAKHGVHRLVFSSSATVYGDATRVPIDETCPTSQPANPYGASKLTVEHLLHSLAASDPRWRIAILRYFNPAGAHPSGEIGEQPNGTPNNLLPYVAQVAAGLRPRLHVFGDDYATPDGTGVRDYVHVVDLADGHLKALDAITRRGGIDTWNLGSGRGYSVLEIVRAFEQASGAVVPYAIGPRRPGDVATSIADVGKAARDLDWHPRRALDEMMRDAWRWEQRRAGAVADGARH